MSETTTNPSSEDTLIRDSQISGFAAFKERLAYCCCRAFKRTSKYNLSSVSKDNEEKQDKPSYVNQAFQGEKQARKDKLEKIAKTLPGGTLNETRIPGSVTQTPTRTTGSVIQTPTRSLTKVGQGTPRSGIGLAQTRPPISTPISKPGISRINKPSPSAANTKNNKKDSDETNSDDSSEEESSSDDDKSSDSDSALKKRGRGKKTKTRR